MDELMAMMGEPLKGLKKGDIVDGTISFVSAKHVRIDIGGKTEGVVHDKEVSSLSSMFADFGVGTKVKALVINSENDRGEAVLSLRHSIAEKRWDMLKEKMGSAEVMQVSITESGKGGFLIDAFGIRGFLPFSQADQQMVQLKEKAISRRVKVKVIELDQAANRFIVSQRFEGAEGSLGRQLELLKKIKVGDTYDAEVSGVVPFGAFAKITVARDEPVIEGLIHISEIAWEKVEKPEDYLKVGAKKQVKVIGVDEKSGRLTLSLKQLQPDPWLDVAKAFEPDAQVTGEVVRVSAYGIFVRIAAGVEGLIHISKVSPGEEPKVGDTITCIVEDIDIHKRKVSLSMISTAKPIGYR